jgi:hypothetical protein
MALQYATIATVLEGLELTREQFASIHHVNEEPRTHIEYLRNRRSQWYESGGRNGQTALRLVLVKALVSEYGFSTDEACGYAREAMPVER